MVGALLVLAAAGKACRSLTGGVDFWAHAAVGRWMWESGRWPSQTLFVWGAEPTPWVAHSWGTQAIFALVMRAGGARWGPTLTIAMTVLLSAAPFALWWLYSRVCAARIQSETVSPESRWLRDGVLAGAFALAIHLSWLRFTPRPELFTANLLCLQLLALLEWSRLNTRRRWVVALGLWMLWLVWANLHGAWAFALVILALTVAAEAAQNALSSRRERDWGAVLSLAGVAVGCLLVTLLNPYGTQLWRALGAVRSQTFDSIAEWKTPLASPPLSVWYPIGETALVLVALGAWLLNSRRRWAHLAWLAFAYASFWDARRYLWLLALVALAVLLGNARAFEHPLWQRGERAVARSLRLHPTGAWVGALVFPLLAWGLAARALPRVWEMPAVSSRAPVELTKAFRREVRRRGRDETRVRVFNDYEYSSYWQWAFAGRPPLFIDLLNAYPDRLMADYFRVIDRRPRGLRLLARAEAVLSRAPSSNESLKGFHAYLDARPREWRRVYKGRDGVVWLRSSAFAAPRSAASRSRR
jgi:hypothetical protein